MGNSQIFLIGEAWGQHEETLQFPFVGSSGLELLKMLNTAKIISLTPTDQVNISAWYNSNPKSEYRNPYFLMLVWKAHPEVYTTNVFNLRPQPSNDIKNICGPKKEGIKGYPALQQGKYVHGIYEKELKRLVSEISSRLPNIIIALGATPAWALLKTTGIKSIRGAPVQTEGGIKVIPTYHPAAVLRDWSLRPIVIADLAKAKKESEFPEVRRPSREIWIEPTIPDLHEFYARFIAPADQVSEDIENIGPVITCVGFAPSIDRALVIPFFDQTKPDHNYWSTFEEEREAWQFIDKIHRTKKLLFQNGLYDINHLWKTMHLPAIGADDDTMLLHHALQPELNKGLGFMGSIYTTEASWKMMRGEVETMKKED